jgi:hypothetical protein
MSSAEQTTFHDDQHAEGQHTDDVAGQQRGSTAAERLGGPTESEQRVDEARRHGSNGHGAGEQRATLIPRDRADSYNKRWTEIKGEFVDDPRTAVRGANAMVGEVLDELEELFRKQRDEIEHGLDSDEASTEDLRVALGRYRSFFDRLLSF